MNRIESVFAELRDDGAKALMPFVTAGYPSLAATEAVLRATDAAGAAICELGIPFSDPIADGPVIQASMTDALAAGCTPGGVFDLVRRVRDEVAMGLVAMVSYSIVYRIGVDAFIERAKAAGIDGFIFPDLTLEECEPINAKVAEAGLTASLLIAPTSPPQRAAAIARTCTGFVYVVARTGITGERDSVPADLAKRVGALRNETDLPITVGFGISKAEHVRAVVQVADAAIVGSALVRKISEVKDQPTEAIARHVGEFVGELATGLT
jgi:tryptophan synthase alpha chain